MSPPKYLGAWDRSCYWRDNVDYETLNVQFGLKSFKIWIFQWASGKLFLDILSKSLCIAIAKYE